MFFQQRKRERQLHDDKACAVVSTPGCVCFPRCFPFFLTNEPLEKFFPPGAKQLLMMRLVEVELTVLKCVDSFFYDCSSQMGWRLGLQAATGLLLSAFFLGTFYRSASLYHPQRRAILHLKTQRKKVRVIIIISLLFSVSFTLYTLLLTGVTGPFLISSPAAAQSPFFLLSVREEKLSDVICGHARLFQS